MRDDVTLLYDIRTATEKALAYVDGMTFDDFDDDERTQDAVIRQMEIIGEAAKRVSTSFRESHPDVPWKDLTGMRDVLAHQYDGVDIDIVWETVESDFPNLLDAVSELIEQLK
jgi:uncharacterized protein with HEPN domain